MDTEAGNRGLKEEGPEEMEIAQFPKDNQFMENIMDVTEEVIHVWNGWLMEDNHWSNGEVKTMVPIKFKEI